MACLWLICTGAAAIGAGYAVFAASCVRRLRRWPARAAASLPDTTILKPLYGAEPELQANLESFLRQDYPGRVQVIFGVHDPADPAAASARAAIVAAGLASQVGVEQGNGRCRAELVADPTRHGSNGKVSNLINMMREARHGTIVLADSDMRVAPDYLRHIAAALHQPGVGAVTCLYRGLPVAGLWSRLSALAIDTHFLPSVLVALRLGLARPCFGSTIALGRDTLARAGGFETLKDRLADDYELGAAVRRLGLSVAIPPMLVAHCCSEASFTELMSHEIRWARTIRLVDPVGFAGSVVTHPLPFALAALALDGGTAASGALLAVTLACRLWVQIQVAGITGDGRGGWALVPARDLLSFAVFVASLWPGSVRWRGEKLGVRRDGTMTPDGPSTD